MWEACPLSFSLQLSDLHSSCTHTQAHTRGFHDACAPYATILSDHDKVLVSLSPSSPCTTLDSFHIHTDNTARTLPPSFLIFSTYFVLPTSAHHHFILCITIGHTLPQSAFWVNEYQTALPASWEIYVQVKKPQLKLDMEKKKKLDMEQRTGSKSGKKYIKAVYCHLAYLTYMQSTSCEMLGWMKHKLESRLLGEIWITSDMQMTPPLWQKVKN